MEKPYENREYLSYGQIEKAVYIIHKHLNKIADDMFREAPVSP